MCPILLATPLALYLRGLCQCYKSRIRGRGTLPLPLLYSEEPGESRFQKEFRTVT